LLPILNLLSPDILVFMTKRAVIPMLLICAILVLCSCATTGAAPSQRYFEAEKCHATLKGDIELKKYRSNWLNCIGQFENVWRMDPEGPWAAAGMYKTGELYRELYGYSHSPADDKKADDIFREVARRYPKSAYRKRAEDSIKQLSGPEDPIATLTGVKTTSGEVTAAANKQDTRSVSGDSASVTGIRYWSNPDYTRIVIDANREIRFTSNFLKKDPSINLHHERLYVDLDKSRLSEKIQPVIPIDDSHLNAVRAGQFCPETVRVVVDMKSYENYKVFALKNPFRIVIDVLGKSEGGAPPGPKAGTFHAGEIDQKAGAASIARQLALGVRRVVIDAGHGGRDYGAPGAVPGVHEKHITLAIAKQLAEKVKRDLGLEVIMTRTTDTYLTLEERTAIANTYRADLFISIHANAARNKNAHGIETYFLNLTTDDESIAVAARENATSEKNISELQGILNDLMQNAKINESSRLATYVQNSVYRNVSGQYKPVVNKGVKQAPFYVLLGAQMPSILIETGFISNPQECRRLMDPLYQKALCNGIIEGMRAFINDTRPPAMVSME
jgi:N-acetylmuramoyl-L-alanine amidase